MKKYVFWNNKGGTGKTSLAFQTLCHFAEKNQNKKILVIDMCPQANLSELLLGGLSNNGSNNLLLIQGVPLRCSIGGYFQMRLPNPYSKPNFNPYDFISEPHKYNDNIPDNVDLVCGDPLLELQSNAISTLANNQIPGLDTWVSIIDWLSDFISTVKEDYDYVFIDTNPSFSMYTQIAISAADLLILPVMADDSSRRAIQNVFSLIYGLKLPSDIYSKYAFATKLENSGRLLPKVHLVIKNRLTQYMGPASAYSAVLLSIEENLQSLMQQNPNMFSNHNLSEILVEARDFQTTGVVAFAKGCPFFKLQPGRITVGGQRIQVKAEYLEKCQEEIDKIIARL